MGIGMATTQWAHIENNLFLMSLNAFGASKAKQLAPSFFSIENFRSKLAFTDKAFQAASAYSRLAADWAEIRDKVESLSSTRNKIAHGRVIVFPQSSAGRRYAIVPRFSKDTRPKPAKPPTDAICVREIDLASRQFGWAASRLMKLYALASNGDRQLATLVLPEPQLRSLAELASQTRAMLPPSEQSPPL